MAPGSLGPRAWGGGRLAGPRDVARCGARPHHVQQRQHVRTQGWRGATGREPFGRSAGPSLPPHPCGPAESGADGHAADCLHLREQLSVDQLQCLQILRSGHHLQLDHDPGLLPGSSLPPLPHAHLYQLAPVGTSALFNRYPAPPHRVHRGSLQELQPERAGSRSDLWFRGHLPLPGERVAVLQDLLCDPVSRCSRLRTPQAPGPQQTPRDMWPSRREDPRAGDRRKDF